MRNRRSGETYDASVACARYAISFFSYYLFALMGDFHYRYQNLKQGRDCGQVMVLIGNVLDASSTTFGTRFGSSVQNVRTNCREHHHLTEEQQIIAMRLVTSHSLCPSYPPFFAPGPETSQSCKPGPDKPIVLPKMIHHEASQLFLPALFPM